MATEEAAAPDLGALRASLGLPPVGVRLDRAQSLRLLAALDAGREPIPDHALAWARQTLGVRAHGITG